eukprot:gene6654-4797_t
MALLEDRDVFNIVAFEYLDMKDLINLDTAIVEDTERRQFLELLETVPYKPPFHSDLEKWWIHHKDCLAWLSKRKMYSPEGAPWHVNKKSWMSLLNDSSFDFKLLLSKLKDVFFEGFGSPFDLQGLELCDSLEKLHLCNYNLPERATTLATCPRLKELILQNSKVCDATLHNFRNVASLKQLTLRHVTFEQLSEDILDHYLRSLQTVQVMNRVDDFFRHFCAKPNSWEVAYFDLLHTTQNNEFSFEPFLKVSPHLRELHIERTCVDINALFAQLSQFCPYLEFLHLNHVRISTAGASPPFEGTVSFSRLQISTLLPPLDEQYTRILTMTGGKIQHLHISFAERLTDGGLLTARDLCPHLQSFQFEEKAELLEATASGATEVDNQTRAARIAAAFAGVPNVKIVAWNKWMFEHLKEKNAHERRVLFERGDF